LIPSTLFGAGYHTESKQLHFIFDLIRKIVRGKLYGEKVSLWGDGEQKRELIYLPDFVRAAIDLSGRVDNEIVNIGSGDERSIRWYAEHVSRLVGFDAGSISYDKDRYTGVRSKQLRIDKLRRLLPGFELTPLEVALSETVQWYEREILSSLGQGLLANDRVSS
jgi:GDP-L-fucose synthase